jgi:hypothetical protein
MKKVSPFVVNTTAYEEENFVLITDLTEKQIVAIIEPLVLMERSNGNEYNNDDLVNRLCMAYPNNYIEHYSDVDSITKITI